MSQKNSKSGGKSGSGQKGKSGAAQKQAPPTPTKNSTVFIALAAVAVLVIGVIIVAGGGKDTAGGGASAGVQPSAEEAKYLGRLLPASYEETAVASPATYNATVEMTELTAATTDTQISVPLADVTAAKLVLFKYTRTDGSSLPLIAYVKPSGKLFVGVSFCPPCQGEWQTIQGDGTLTCNSCGTKRDLETMAGISGACKLYPLDEVPVALTDTTISIDRAVLDSWTSQPLDRQVG